MRRNTNQRRRRSTHTYSEEQLAGLHASTTARKQETIERLQAAITSLKKKKQEITAQTIYAECGLHYSSYVRNEEAIALFRADSTYLAEKKQRSKRKRKTSEATCLQSSPCDRLLNYKKPQVVMRLREAQQEIEDLQRQLATLADACLQRDARVVELEAKLAELEPYRSFVEQVRMRIRREEHDQDTPSP